MQGEASKARDGNATEEEGDSPTVATNPGDNEGNEAVRQIGEAKIRAVVPKSVFVEAKGVGNPQQDGTNPALRSRQETTLTTTATAAITEVPLAGLIAGEELADNCFKPHDNGTDSVCSSIQMSNVLELVLTPRLTLAYPPPLMMLMISYLCWLL